MPTNREELRGTVFSQDLAVRRKCQERFGPEIDEFLDDTVKAADAYEKLDALSGSSTARAFAAAYVFQGIHNLTISFALLV